MAAAEHKDGPQQNTDLHRQTATEEHRSTRLKDGHSRTQRWATAEHRSTQEDGHRRTQIYTAEKMPKTEHKDGPQQNTDLHRKTATEEHRSTRLKDGRSRTQRWATAEHRSTQADGHRRTQIYTAE